MEWGGALPGVGLAHPHTAQPTESLHPHPPPTHNNRWILEGELQDPHHEFFVACVSGDPSPAPAPAASAEGYGDGGGGLLPFDERLWHHTYCLRRDMVPRYVGCLGGWGGGVFFWVWVYVYMYTCIQTDDTTPIISHTNRPKPDHKFNQHRFIPLELAQRILVLGKTVAFMQRCCRDREWCVRTRTYLRVRVCLSVWVKTRGVTYRHNRHVRACVCLCG